MDKCTVNKCKVILDLTYGLRVIAEVEGDEDRGIVIAKAKGCEELGILSLDDAFHSITEMTVAENSLLWKKLQMKPVYVSVAHCAPEDEFDFYAGMDIATKRLQDKLNEKIVNRRRMMAKELWEMAARCALPSTENACGCPCCNEK